jgi:hypothetical protein
MALGDILVHVNAKLAGVEALIGSEHIGRHGAPPRIIWVPDEDTFQRGAERRGMPIPAATATVKMRGVRNAGVRAQLWAVAPGSDTTEYSQLSAVENLINWVLEAVYEVTHGDYEILGGKWMDIEGQAVGQYGRGYELSLSFPVPIAYVPPVPAFSSATISSAVIAESTVEFADSEVTGVPMP